MLNHMITIHMTLAVLLLPLLIHHHQQLKQRLSHWNSKRLPMPLVKTIKRWGSPFFSASTWTWNRALGSTYFFCFPFLLSFSILLATCVFSSPAFRWDVACQYGTDSTAVKCWPIRSVSSWSREPLFMHKSSLTMRSSQVTYNDLQYNDTSPAMIIRTLCECQCLLSTDTHSWAHSLPGTSLQECCLSSRDTEKLLFTPCERLDNWFGECCLHSMRQRIKLYVTMKQWELFCLLLCIWAHNFLF